MNAHASYVIDTLGGSTKVARHFRVSVEAVSQWRRRGIPPLRIAQLNRRKTKPDGYDTLDPARVAESLAPPPKWLRKP